MTQRSHVPKFGNWDNDNVPYTAYFDNARKEKTSPTRSRINPNDPEENPDAFNLHNSPPEEENHHRRGNSHRRTNSDHRQRIGGGTTTRSINSESGSERSNSDYSHHLKKSQPSDGSSNSVSPLVPTPSQTRLRSIGNPPSNDTLQGHRVASVPKFGAWDETDPTSGEGFTVIFNKVKQERQVASTTLPTVPPPQSVHSNTHKRNQKSSFGSKICCCFWA